MSIKIIRGLPGYQRPSGRPVVATTGTFDGIHRGHQEILRRVLAAGEATGYAPVLVTFHPHPRMLVTPDDAPLLLTTIEEKEQFLPDFFRGTVLVLDFTSELMSFSAEQFVRDILIDKLGMKKLVVGHDHAFGKNRSGSADELAALGKRWGFDVEVVGPVMLDNQRISSTYVRTLLREGRVDEAVRVLGHPYAIYGTVEKGIGLGHKLGYPTANLRCNPRKLLPRQGVYACRVRVRGLRENGMMFIGRNHFNPQERVTVEINLFDFDEDLYDTDITVCPVRFVREGRKFESTEALARQIRKDKDEIVKIIQREKRDVRDKRAESRDYC
ncbi:MAG: bifunctional riboflavin kinase/FAD synthetase [candidate division Zixibacteria bacterium]|nr:bifunctional riboflavin kinase/FAD synthetase [candidate division Zixibacteria bacterium]